jgi:Tol biopolymer transport system component
MALTGHRQQAEDLLQTALAKSVRHWSRIRHPARAGVMEVSTGRVRWIDGYNGAGAWSPDGRRILLTGGPAGLSQQASTEPRNNGFVLLDTADLRPTFYPIPDVPNGFGARGVWTPDGQAIAITICACANGAVHNGPWPVTGIRLYDLRGHQLRTLPATAGLWSEAAFSPDGTAMVLTPENAYPHLSVQIADARTGAGRQSLRLPDGEFTGWYDADHLIVRSGPERGSTTSVLLIVDLRGHVVRTVPLRPGDPGEQSLGLSAGSAAGVPDPSHTP